MVIQALLLMTREARGHRTVKYIYVIIGKGARGPSELWKVTGNTILPTEMALDDRPARITGSRGTVIDVAELAIDGPDRIVLMVSSCPSDPGLGMAFHAVIHPMQGIRVQVAIDDGGGAVGEVTSNASLRGRAHMREDRRGIGAARGCRWTHEITTLKCQNAGQNCG